MNREARAVPVLRSASGTSLLVVDYLGNYAENNGSTTTLVQDLLVLGPSGYG